MAAETTLTNGKPGVAEFKSETFGNFADLRFGDAPVTMTNITITASGANIELPLYAVINLAGTALADYKAPRDADCANYVLAEPILIADGESMTVPVIRTGHLNIEALTWDESAYDTDAKKLAAFEGSVSPTIFLGKPAYNSDQIV